jgi:hypothetical protein
MALSKKGKLWITLVSIPIVLLLIIFIGLKVYLTSERLKTLVIPQIESSIHRTVTVSDMSFSVFPSLAISIDSLTVSNPPNRKFDRSPFLMIENIRLKVSLFALIGGNVDVNYIVCERPIVYLEATEENTNNYSLSDEPAKPSIPDTARMQAGAFLLSNLEINNGEIEFVNKKSNSRMRINGYSQTLSVESKSNESGIHVAGTASIKQFSYGSLTTWLLKEIPFDAKLSLTYAPSADLLAIDDVTMKLNDLPLVMTGSVSNVRGATMLFDMKIVSPGMSMPQILSLIPPDMLKAAKGLSSSGDVTFTTIIKGAFSDSLTPSVTGSFALSNGKIQYTSLPKSITGINVRGSFDKPEARAGVTGGGRFSIETFEALLGSSKMGGSMTVSNFDDPSIRASFNGMMNLGEVKDFYPLEQGTEIGGTLTANASIDGKVKLPQAMKATGSIGFANVTMKTATSPKPLKNLNGTISFNNQLVESKQLAMNIGESDLSLGFGLKNYMGIVSNDAVKSAGKPSVTLTLTSKQLRIADLMSEEKPAATEQKSTEKKQTGMLPGFDINANVNIGKLVTEKFTFTDARGTVAISNGIITLKNFSVNAFDGTIKTKGTLDLRDEKKRPFDLDLDITGVQSNAMLSNFTSFGQNIFGKISMSTKMKGDLNDTLGFDRKSLSGSGKLQIADGKLTGFPLTTKLAEVTNLTELREINFKNWTNAFTIADGRVNINDLKVNSGLSDFLVNGSHGLDGSMAYNLTTKLPASVSDRLKLGGTANQLLQFFKDKDGRINLNFTVSGMTSSPALKLDTKAQEEAAKSQLLEQGKKKLDDQLKKKADGLLKLFKKP